MELNREQVKKELALFIDDNPVELHFHHKKTSKFLSFLKLVLDVITTDEQKIFELENRLKECENGYEGTLYLERCKLHDAEQKVKELTEQNEKWCSLIVEATEHTSKCNKKLSEIHHAVKNIIEERDRYKRYYFNHEYDKLEADVRADTVRKIQERATTFFSNDDTLKYVEVDAKYINEQIDRIVKEVLEGEE